MFKIIGYMKYMKYARIGLGIAAAAVAGAAVYALVTESRREAKLVMPKVKRGKLLKFPSGRPPYAEAAEAGD
ncbi:MAG: hypothetical protein HZC51_06865 [Nitrospirae bacterium]|nr:hypothetical protein [Nitrospirota bacterium]